MIGGHPYHFMLAKTTCFNRSSFMNRYGVELDFLKIPHDVHIKQGSSNYSLFERDQRMQVQCLGW